MLKFFRKIRQKLLAQNKIGQYLKYALGEIFLVVIGILIALQINNWNEGRKAQKLSHDILLEIKENLKYNIQKAKEEIGSEYEVIQAIDIISEQFFEARTYHDTLDRHFHNSVYWPTASWRVSGYETLKSRGVEVVESKELRSSNIDLYEIKYGELAEIIRSSENYAQGTSMIVQTRFQYQFAISDKLPTSVGRARPLDFRELQKSQDFYGFLSFWKVLRMEGVRLRNNVIAYSESVIDEIDKELNQ